MRAIKILAVKIYRLLWIGTFIGNTEAGLLSWVRCDYKNFSGLHWHANLFPITGNWLLSWYQWLGLLNTGWTRSSLSDSRSQNLDTSAWESCSAGEDHRRRQWLGLFCNKNVVSWRTEDYRTIIMRGKTCCWRCLWTLCPNWACLLSSGFSDQWSDLS